MSVDDNMSGSDDDYNASRIDSSSVLRDLEVATFIARLRSTMLTCEPDCYDQSRRRVDREREEVSGATQEV
jgi:hypothetical protein